MNELKQIRSMAEMILEKIDALEGAKPFPQNGFREFVHEINVWMPKFAIGDTVYYKPDGGDEEYDCTISGIHPTYNSYMVVSHGGLYEYWVAEKFLRGEPAVKEPKFKVGDRVSWYDGLNNVSKGTVKAIIAPAYSAHLPLYDVQSETDEMIHAVAVNEGRMTTSEDDREWHSGPPPHVGWWNASNTKNLGAWRWWNGSSWSWLEYDCSSDLATIGQTVNASSNKSFKWTDYWPENARVPRIDPRNVK